MASYNWLHISDLHQGMEAQNWLWPQVRQLFFDDLARLHEQAGPWDLILFTGDLTQRGAAQEFDALNQTLESLFEHLRKLGSTPALIAVPGNHDLVRPKKKDPVLRLLERWHEEPDVRMEFWAQPKSAYRKVINKAFANYQKWFKAWLSSHPLPAGAQVSYGMLPGDLSVSLKLDSLQVAIVGLNSTFLQLTGGEHQGKLDIQARQLTSVCDGDPDAWLRKHHVTLLMTHQPPSWLSENARRHFQSEIAPPGRFLVHLFGHMHEPIIQSISTAGSELQRYWQAPSLFGLEKYDTHGEQRNHGYCAARVTMQGSEGSLQLWPRALKLSGAGAWHMVPDPLFHLGADGATMERFQRAIATAAPGTDRALQPPGTAYDAAWYIPRPREEQRAQDYLRFPGRPVVLWGPEWMGKTWLLERLVDEAGSKPGMRIISADVGLADGEARSSLDSFLHWLAGELVRALGGRPEWVEQTWDEPGAPTSKITKLLESELLSRIETEGRLMLVLDRADRVWRSSFQDDFFSLLRAWAERTRPPVWKKLRLVLAISTAPQVLIEDVSRSPFNLSEPIEVGEFDETQMEELAGLYGLRLTAAEKRALRRELGGHCYLLRAIFYTSASQSRPIVDLLQGRMEQAPAIQEYLLRWRTRLAREKQVFDGLREVANNPQAVLKPEIEQRLQAMGLISEERSGTRRLRYRFQEYLLF